VATQGAVLYATVGDPLV